MVWGWFIVYSIVVVYIVYTVYIYIIYIYITRISIYSIVYNVSIYIYICHSGSGVVTELHLRRCGTKASMCLLA